MVLRNDAIVGPNAAILRTLRIKFIAVNMLLALIVLASSFAVVLYSDYMMRFNAIVTELESVISDVSLPHVPQIASTQRLTSAEESLSSDPATAEAQGSAKSAADSQGANAPGSRTVAQSSSTSNGSADSINAPTIGSSTKSKGSVILVSAYSVKPNGIYTTLSRYTNANIPESTIIGANEKVLASDKPEGYLSEYNLFYVRKASASDPGSQIIAYADGSSMSAWQNLAITLGFVGLGSLVVLFLLNIFFSKWALRPVEVSIKQQQQFTADASHELKTPLTVILANMAILKSQGSSQVEDQMQWVESTEREAERMQLLVNDMLALSRPEDQKKQVAMEKVDFSDLVEGEVLQFESVAFELGVELDDSIDENLEVKGNEERLGRMVATLIDNACKYAESSVDVTLVKKASSTSPVAKAELKVHNDGPCIPKEDLPYIFQRFYRADKVRTSSKGGYGLGLAIAQEIAHEHGTSIVAESSPEEGTTFTMTIPLV